MVDLSKLEAAIRLFLEAIGEDLTREGLEQTPKRVAKAAADLFGGCSNDLIAEGLVKSFCSNFEEMVLVDDINFCSFCEHHILPFFGTVSLAYVPDGRIIGLSKIARLVDFFSKRLQVQENLTDKIADAVFEEFSVKGVMVLVRAVHTCMAIRGVKKFNSSTVTISKKGVFKFDEGLQNYFFKAIGLSCNHT